MGDIRQLHDPLRPSGRRTPPGPRMASEPPNAPPSSPDRLALGTGIGLGSSQGPRGPADVRREAETLWYASAIVQPASSYRRVERDALDVNPPRKPQGLADALRGLPVVKALTGGEPAERMIEANRSLAEEALSSMPAERQAQWKAVEAMTREDPLAHLALQVLLIEGRLTGVPNHEGQDLLGALYALASRPLMSLLEKERPALVSDLIQEIAVPSAISQHNRGTCTVTSVQITLAMTQPAEYARLVHGLASPEGKVSLAGQGDLLREPDFEQDPTPRSWSAKLLQPALMEYANGDQLDYDNTVGKHRRLDGTLTPEGGLSSLTGVLGDLNAERFEFGFSASEASAQRVLERIQGYLAKGRPVTAGMQWGEPDAQGQIHGAHEVVVTRVEADRVYYHNPWGIEESMAVADFKKRLLGVEVPSATP